MVVLEVRLGFLLALAAQAPVARAWHPDLATLVESRDSFVYLANGKPLGYLVRQLRIVPAPWGGQAILEDHLYSTYDTLDTRDHYAGDARSVMDLHSGEVVSFSLNYHSLPARRQLMDTIQYTLRIEVRSGRAVVEALMRTRDGRALRERPITRTLPTGTIWRSARALVAAALPLEPGDSVALFSYHEAFDSVEVATFVAEAPIRARLPVGDLEVLPVRLGDLHVLVTRAAPRRAVRIEVGPTSHYDLVRSVPP